MSDLNDVQSDKIEKPAEAKANEEISDPAKYRIMYEQEMDQAAKADAAALETKFAPEIPEAEEETLPSDELNNPSTLIGLDDWVKADLAQINNCPVEERKEMVANLFESGAFKNAVTGVEENGDGIRFYDAQKKKYTIRYK